MHLDQPRLRPSEVPERPEGAGAGTKAPSPGRLAIAFRFLVAAVLVVAVALRFLARSPLWLDEALTVNIAKAPLSQIPRLLRDDGAPPLYYFLLHFWMKLFGTGDIASRSLAGVCGVINLPIAWITGYRVGSRWWSLDHVEGEQRSRREERGRTTAWAVTLLLATSPFAVYYDTEARMYGFVLLLGTLAVLAATSLLRRPGWAPSLAVAVVTAALLYSHYWALYVGLVAGAAALWCAVKGPHERAARYALAGLILGGLSFVPWLPTFWFQLHHTGTPWAQPADFTDIVFAFTQFAGGNSSPGRALALLFFFLGILAVFGAAVDNRHVMLDLRTRPGMRAVTAGVLATLFIAVVAGQLSDSAFADRYTSVIAFPALLIFAYGLTTISSVRVRQGLLVVAIALGLAASIPNARLLRTQAGEVAAAISARAHAGDVIAYCPDQLGPSVSRLLGPNYLQTTFPRATGPEIVDWVNYDATIKRASPFRFAQMLRSRAGGHTIWYVSAPDYQGFGSLCTDIALDLGRYRTGRTIVANAPSDTPFEVYEGMGLERFSAR
jgi:mannosyltransferase